MSITIKSVAAATLSVDNSASETRSFDISARVRVESGQVQNVEGGQVQKDGSTVASFSKYGTSNFNLSVNSGDVDKAEVLTAIEEFISECETGCANVNVTVSD